MADSAAHMPIRLVSLKKKVFNASLEEDSSNTVPFVNIQSSMIPRWKLNEVKQFGFISNKKRSIPKFSELGC